MVYHHRPAASSKPDFDVPAIPLDDPLAGFIDKETELARLGKEIGKKERELSQVAGKLANTNFVDRAPAAVVAKEREKMQSHEQALDTLREQLQRIQSL